MILLYTELFFTTIRMIVITHYNINIYCCVRIKNYPITTKVSVRKNTSLKWATHCVFNNNVLVVSTKTAIVSTDCYIYTTKLHINRKFYPRIYFVLRFSMG